MSATVRESFEILGNCMFVDGIAIYRGIAMATGDAQIKCHDLNLIRANSLYEIERENKRHSI